MGFWCVSNFYSSSESSRNPLKGWQKDTGITSGPTIPRVGSTTPDVSLVVTKPRALMSSRPAWPTVGPASAFLAQWGKTRKATSRTVAHPLTAILTLSQRRWCAHVCSKKRAKSPQITASERFKTKVSLAVLYLALCLFQDSTNQSLFF